MPGWATYAAVALLSYFALGIAYGIYCDVRRHLRTRRQIQIEKAELAQVEVILEELELALFRAELEDIERAIEREL